MWFKAVLDLPRSLSTAAAWSGPQTIARVVWVGLGWSHPGFTFQLGTAPYLPSLVVILDLVCASQSPGHSIQHISSTGQLSSLPKTEIDWYSKKKYFGETNLLKAIALMVICIVNLQKLILKNTWFLFAEWLIYGTVNSPEPFPVCL